MSRQKTPLIKELLDYFEQTSSDSSPRYLDLPRASVVEAIPKHRSNDDFVELPNVPLPRGELLESFLSDRGVLISDPAEQMKIIEQRGWATAFSEYVSMAAREHVQHWLEEQGVIYTL